MSFDAAATLFGVIGAGVFAPAVAQQPFPTLLPPWEPVWRLDRSTIAMPCNYSGWFDPELAAQFGVVSFDWANHENSWRSRPLDGEPRCVSPHGTIHPPGCFYPDAEDLVEQVQRVKAVNKVQGTITRTWVYRQGQGAGSPSGHQSRELLTDPKYAGFFLKTVNGTDLPGKFNHSYFDFRNASLIDWFANEYVGGEDCLAHPDIDGLYLDDTSGLGSPGTPDVTPVVNVSGLSPASVAEWNAGQRKTVTFR